MRIEKNRVYAYREDPRYTAIVTNTELIKMANPWVFFDRLFCGDVYLQACSMSPDDFVKYFRPVTELANIRLRLELDVEVDPRIWEWAYGVSGNPIRADVQSYLDVGSKDFNVHATRSFFVDGNGATVTASRLASKVLVLNFGARLERVSCTCEECPAAGHDAWCCTTCGAEIMAVWDATEMHNHLQAVAVHYTEEHEGAGNIVVPLPA